METQKLDATRQCKAKNNNFHPGIGFVFFSADKPIREHSQYHTGNAEKKKDDCKYKDQDRNTYTEGACDHA